MHGEIKKLEKSEEGGSGGRTHGERGVHQHVARLQVVVQNGRLGQVEEEHALRHVWILQIFGTLSRC